MKFENRSYPDIFPPDCPPVEAKHEKITVYRMVKDKVLTPDDFKSYVELGIRCRPTKNPKYGEYAISVNPNYEELDKQRRAVGYLKKTFKYIAIGDTYLCTGVVCIDKSKNQPSHHEWWLFKEAVPHKYFKVVEGSEICNDTE